MDHIHKSKQTSAITPLGSFETMNKDYLKISFVSYVITQIVISWSPKEIHLEPTLFNGGIIVDVNGNKTVVEHSFTKPSDTYVVPANTYKYLVLPVEGEICNIELQSGVFADDKHTYCKILFTNNSPKIHHE